MKKLFILIEVIAMCLVMNICHAKNDVWVDTYYELEYYVDLDTLTGFKDDFGVYLDTRNTYNGETGRMQMTFTKYDDLHVLVVVMYEDGTYGGCGYVIYDKPGPATNTYFLCIKELDKHGGRM